MKLKVLGSYGGDFKGRFPAFLVNDAVLLDAGSIGIALTQDDQIGIHTILLTHHHIDHMLGIPFFADAIFSLRDSPVEIFALESVIDNLKKHLINDVLWPDFTRLPNSETPTIRCNAIELNREYSLPEGLTFTAAPTCHIGPSCGYILRQDNTYLAYTGDTGPCDRFWDAMNQYQSAHPDACLSVLIIECSFPRQLNSFALETKHLSPDLLETELKKLNGPMPELLIFHMKPRYLNAIENELQTLIGDRIKILRPDTTYSIDNNTVRRLE